MKTASMNLEILTVLKNLGNLLLRFVRIIRNLISALLILLHLFYIVPTIIGVIINLNGQSTGGFTPKALHLFEGPFGALMAFFAILVSLFFYFDGKWKKGTCFFIDAIILFCARSFVTLFCCFGS